MKLGEIDWSILRGAIVFLAVSALVGGTLVYASVHYAQLAEREHTQERRQLNSVRGQYQTLDDEQRIIETYLPQYEVLEERGIVGREQRLNWVETLRAVAEALKLPSLRYELSPQKVFEKQFPVPEGVYKVFVSEMRLEVGLLHEGDLLALLRELNRNSKGLFSVSGCFLRRQSPELKMEPKASNVNASCTLQWFTVAQPPEEESA